MLPINSELGSLDYIEVHDYYDFPRLFTAQDLESTRGYLAVWIDTLEDVEEFLWVRLDSWHMLLFELGLRDIRDSFLLSDSDFYRVRIGPTSLVQRIAATDIKSELLPPVGDRMTPKDPDTAQAIERLRSIPPEQWERAAATLRRLGEISPQTWIDIAIRLTQAARLAVLRTQRIAAILGLVEISVQQRTDPIGDRDGWRCPPEWAADLEDIRRQQHGSS